MNSCLLVRPVFLGICLFDNNQWLRFFAQRQVHAWCPPSFAPLPPFSLPLSFVSQQGSLHLPPPTPSTVTPFGSPFFSPTHNGDKCIDTTFTMNFLYFTTKLTTASLYQKTHVLIQLQNSNWLKKKKKKRKQMLT